MGLDITAYRNIRKLDCAVDEDGEPVSAPDCRHTVLHINPSFPGRADEIEDGGVYAYDSMLDFRAGSYGGYNNWRDKLAALAGYPEGEYESYGSMHKSHCASCWEGAAGPFAELINFSDCEGVIGTAVAAKLHDDFNAYAEKAAAHEDPWFYDRYENWRQAFAMAADGGAVCFH
jgi:hypothetical protein